MFERALWIDGSRLATLLPLALILLAALFVLYGVGFAQPELLHNAAHDTRHAFSFPCH
ncbi:MAG: CbtB domain-containing protein [Alphaproteobacteria bacterium]|nr:CbtB-domain containing protein [Pseudomonadota bacterium]